MKNTKTTEQKFWTVKELADFHGVVRRVALGWIQQGKFAGAVKAETDFGTKFWTVPESEVRAFVPQQRRGKPHAENATKAAIMRRGKRSKKA